MCIRYIQGFFLIYFYYTSCHFYTISLLYKVHPAIIWRYKRSPHVPGSSAFVFPLSLGQFNRCGLKKNPWHLSTIQISIWMECTVPDASWLVNTGRSEQADPMAEMILFLFRWESILSDKGLLKKSPSNSALTWSKVCASWLWPELNQWCSSEHT